MLENIPDNVKLTGALAAPVLTVFGISVEQWTFILSAVVSILFIIEKLPVFLTRMKTFIRWVKNKYARKE